MISEYRTKSIYIILLLGLGCMALTPLFSCSGDVSGLQVKCNEKGAEVFLDGKSIGACPVSVTPKAGKYILTIKKGIDADTLLFYESPITMQEGKPLKVNAKLSQRYSEKALKEMDSNFVLVKGGCFQMGDVFGDNYSHSIRERPVHDVCLDDFHIGRFEVTQKEWQKVMGNNPSRFVSDRQPVESVSWDDIQKFIGRLNELTGRRYRLPTEAEWEYSARSGGKQERWAGTNNENELTEYAWYSKNSEGTTHLVGLKRPNAIGLYDMSGNVSEMVQDGWSEYVAAPQRNPQGPKEFRHFCMTRGGSFFFGRSDQVRVFDRGSTRSQCPGTLDIGFRLVLSPSQTKH